MPTEMEAVLGIEVHAQLATRTKAFCACALPTALEEGEENTRVCPTCLGLPGALPVYNARALELAVAASLALGCTVREASVFARKNYFYPDLPKGYQISQLAEPLAEHGLLHFELDGVRKTVRINRLHLEEDAGKLVHGDTGVSRVDLNRAGTPLAEIVTEPDLRSAAEAAQYLRELRALLLFVGACDGNLEAGNFRADINISIRPVGSEILGTRVELKNLNSFRFVERAVKVEVERQKALLARGDRVVQETRGYDETTDSTVPLRSKEEAHDYRYFPDPDLPVLRAPAALVEAVRAALPPLPDALRATYTKELALAPDRVAVLLQHPGLAAFFAACLALGAEPQATANFIASDIVRDVQYTGLSARLPLQPGQLTEVLAMIASGSLSLAQAKTLYVALRGTDRAPGELASELGLSQLSDEGPIRAAVEEVVTAHASQVAAYRSGKTALLGFFVGKVMAATQKRANPEVANRLLRELLDTPGEPS